MGGPVTQPGEGGIRIVLTTGQTMTPALLPWFGLMRDLTTTTEGKRVGRIEMLSKKNKKLHRIRDIKKCADF